MALLTGGFGICILRRNANAGTAGRETLSAWSQPSRTPGPAVGCYSWRSCVRTGKGPCACGGWQARSECACHKYQDLHQQALSFIHSTSGRHTARLSVPHPALQAAVFLTAPSGSAAACAAGQGRHAADSATKREAGRQAGGSAMGNENDSRKTADAVARDRATPPCVRLLTSASCAWKGAALPACPTRLPPDATAAARLAPITPARRRQDWRARRKATKAADPLR